MITLPLRFRLVGLPENRCDLLSLQIAHRRPIHLLYRDTCNLRALCYRQGFAIGDKGEEAVDCRQATVAGTTDNFPSSSRGCKNASTSPASRSPNESAATGPLLGREAQPQNKRQGARYSSTVSIDRF